VLLGGYVAGLVASLAWRPSALTLSAAAACSAAAFALLLTASARPAPPPPSLSSTAPTADPEHQVAPLRLPRLSAVAALALLFAVAGAAVGGARLTALERSELTSSIGRRVSLSATLVDLPELRGDRFSLAVRVTALDGRPVHEPAHLALRVEEGETPDLDQCGPLTEGALLTLSGARLKDLPPPPDDGGFDYGRYLRRRGEHVLVEGRYADLRLVGRRSGMTGLVDRLRIASRDHLAAGLRSPVREVLQGMVLGDDERLDPSLIDAFRRSGLLHILAVSGENVVLLCGMWSFALGLLGVRRQARLALLVAVVLVYVLLTGAAPSIVRAGLAGIIGLLAMMVSRPTDGWLLLLAPAALLLSVNPATLFDVSFQLSFAAVAGLLVLARPLTRRLSFLPGPLGEQAGVTTAASLATAPVSLAAFGSASIVAVPANVIGGFVLGLVMFLGMLSLLLGFVHRLVGVPLNLVSGVLLGFLVEVARFFAAPSWAVYEWRGPTLVVVVGGALALEALALGLLARRAGEGVPSYISAVGRRVRITLATAAVLAVALLAAPSPHGAPSEPRLTFLDVGEGAAALVQAPGGPTVLIDAGPEPLAEELRLHGVRRIDLLILSHGHADHTAGLSDVIGGIPIVAALLPRPEQPDATLERLGAELAAAGAEVGVCTSPFELTGTGWSLSVLPTASVGGTDANQAENDVALVVLVRLGEVDVLVPGDAEGEVLARLELPAVDVLEIPHHGSRGGVDASLLERLRPRLAVVSVGPNRFGHPAPEMERLLAEHGVPLLRTDRAGEVIIGAWPAAGSPAPAGVTGAAAAVGELRVWVEQE
jgi:competence protein ComEC